MKEFLTAKGVPFTNRDISADEKAMDELVKLGAMAVPVLVVDGDVIVGFDRTRIQKVLSLS
ncbi:MAG: glutaredoxin family protein [Planctomycetes bacterium]|nr:glutaredoxin family protein [Planctomycetota bacterium]